jgi:peptide/nickel transport system substrate-binding protein
MPYTRNVSRNHGWPWRRPRPEPGWLWLLSLTLLAVVLAGCSERPAHSPSPASVVTITFTQEPDNLNPLYTTMWFSAVTRDFWLRTALLSWNDAQEAVPEIAADIPTESNGGVSADGLTLTYRLRQDVQWSDGTPITAADFVFTYEMLIHPRNTVQTRDPYDTYVASVEAPEPHTLVVRLRQPFAPWRTRIFGSSNGGAIPKHILAPVFQQEGSLDQAAWNRQPTVGHGPFLWQAWESGSHLTFQANAAYWRGKPKVDRLFVRIVPDEAAQIAALKTGNSHLGVFISWADVPELQQLGFLDIVQASSGYKESWFFNLSPERGHPALQDVRVRRALVLAVDRDQLTRQLLYGLTRPARSFWEHSAFADTTTPPIPYDPAEAARLLDAAGWQRGADGTRSKDGRALSLRYVTTNRDIRQHTQVVVQHMLQQIGIHVELSSYASDIFFGGYGDGGPVATGRYDIAQWTTAPDAFPDPDTAQWLCSEIPSEQQPAGTNWMYLCDTTLDRLFRTQASTTDRVARQAYFRDINALLTQQVYWVGLWDDPDVYAVHKDLKHVRLSGLAPFWNCHQWEVDAKSP